MTSSPNHDPAGNTPGAPGTPGKPRLPVHIQGLLGVALAIAVLALMAALLHWRRNGLTVDPSELQMRADSPCMVDGIRAAGGRSITYADLDRIERQCGHR